MRTTRGSGLAAALAALLLTAAPADAQAPLAPGGEVVARVGGQVVTAAALERRLASVPPFQLRTFGKSQDEIRRNFLDRVVVREILLAEGAKSRGIAEREDVGERVRGILRAALLSRTRMETESQPITDAEVRAYYDANAAKYHSPERIAIWRILVGSREDAQRIIAEVKKDVSAKKWNEMARESLDKATSMRGGNLGFVAPDGTAGEAGVRVDPKLVEAARQVKDTEIVGEPVPEGTRWAILWRRQTMKPVDRTLEQEATAIRQVLGHERTEKTVDKLTERLRGETSAEVHLELVDQIEITSTADLQAAKRPGALPASRRPAAASPVPTERPGGLR